MFLDGRVAFAYYLTPQSQQTTLMRPQTHGGFPCWTGLYSGMLRRYWSRELRFENPISHVVRGVLRRKVGL